MTADVATQTPTIKRPDRELMRRLAAHPPGAGKVLTVLVDLDPSTFSTPDARTSQVTSLMNDAEAQIDAADVSHDERVALLEDARMVRSFLLDRMQTNGSRTLVVYASSTAGLFEAVQIPQATKPGAHLGDTPWIAPLAPHVSVETWCVALVNRSTARLFRGAGEDLEEFEEVRDDVHGKHSQGGWSQARFERGVMQEVTWHLDNAGEALWREFERERFDNLVIGTLSELMPEVEGSLHPYLRERLRGRIDVDVEHASLDDVCDAVRPVLEERERAREAALMERLAEGLGTGGRAAAQPRAVLDALEERRVEVVLLDPRSEDADRAIELAVGQSADVIVLRHHDLSEHGSIAALLRF